MAVRDTRLPDNGCYPPRLNFRAGMEYTKILALHAAGKIELPQRVGVVNEDGKESDYSRTLRKLLEPHGITVEVLQPKIYGQQLEIVILDDPEDDTPISQERRQEMKKWLTTDLLPGAKDA